jgi:hypothetical protein
MYILILGNPINGFEFVGLFDGIEDVVEYGEKTYPDVKWWVAPIEIVHQARDKVVITDYGPIFQAQSNKCTCGHSWDQHVQNVHRVYVCTQCQCRNNIGPEKNPRIKSVDKFFENFA